jgi:hypothetical protein
MDGALPKLPKYGRNALRPNPSTASAKRGAVVKGADLGYQDREVVSSHDDDDLAFVQGPVLIGDFGDESASARRTLGLPPEGPVKPGGKPDETRAGWP